jgi:hypothetical protein
MKKIAIVDEFDKFLEILLRDEEAYVGGFASGILWFLRDGRINCGRTRKATIVDLHHPDSLDHLRETFENCKSRADCKECRVHVTWPFCEL